MVGCEQPLDLYKLFMVVKEKGGYEAVCKNRMWDLVGEEYGLGVKVGATVELVYSKHLSTLEAWLKNVADSKLGPECDLVNDRVKFGKRLMEMQAEFMLDDDDDEKVNMVYGYLDGRKLWGTNRVKGFNPELNGAELERVYDYLDGRKLCGVNRVMSKNPESNGAKKVQNGGFVDFNMQDNRVNEPTLRNLCTHKDAMETLKEFEEGKILIVDVSGAIKNMPGLSDGGKRCGNDDDSHNDDVVMLDPPSVSKGSFGRKRKRDSRSEMLSWVTGIAKNPCDPVIASMPEKSKWKSHSNQEIWKQVLLYREAVILKKGFESSGEQLNMQGPKMHPAMYDDQFGANYNLRQRFQCNKSPLSGKSTSNGVSSSGRTRGGSERNPSPHSEGRAGKKSDDSELSRLDIPLGPAHQAKLPEWSDMSYESDSKLLGTQIWPSKVVNSNLLERDPIGKGRQDSCGCQVQGSVECVQFHVAEKRDKVKMELGAAFYQWDLDKVGVEVRHLWTTQDEKKFNDVAKANPPSSDRSFWDHIFEAFPTKSREYLISYYFNVYLLQRVGHRSRHTPNNIESDDDESECGPLRNIFGRRTHTILSHKKPQTKRR